MSAIEIMTAAALSKPVDATTTTLFSPGAAPQAAGSLLTFSRFDIVEVKGRPGHEGEFPIPGEPLPGTATGLAELTQPLGAAEFRLVTESGVLIEVIDLSALDPSKPALAFLGSFEVPLQPFRVAVAGGDSEGQFLDVTFERLFRPQFVEVRFTPDFVVVKPGVVELDAVVTNFGPASGFAIEVSTELGFGVSSDVTELELSEGESAPIVVSLDVPAISTGVLDIHVTATAASVVEPTNSNHGSARARLERFERLFWDGFD